MKSLIRSVRWTGVRRFAVPFGIMGACIWLLATRIDASTFTQLPSAIRAVPLALWGMAAGFAALSL
ncbi:hypothetical protein GV827_00210 [Sulfitobacter sp. JBTF-M27]|uniref:Uncharacterized protein n=1 Tax=Sulfitobacter sediminilitoris TaxID=2698830 RepID=A0A6P0C6U0_9RHOB|nr:hypothetical protein [Sulfitobacter sediminilitoris]NEK20828.1 hypothetical protein [Sulfitobacter sediminilitoris]